MQYLETYSLTTVQDSDPRTSYKRQVEADEAGEIFLYIFMLEMYVLLLRRHLIFLVPSSRRHHGAHQVPRQPVAS